MAPVWHAIGGRLPHLARPSFRPDKGLRRADGGVPTGPADCPGDRLPLAVPDRVSVLGNGSGGPSAAPGTGQRCRLPELPDRQRPDRGSGLLPGGLSRVGA